MTASKEKQAVQAVTIYLKPSLWQEVKAAKISTGKSLQRLSHEAYCLLLLQLAKEKK